MLNAYSKRRLNLEEGERLKGGVSKDEGQGVVCRLRSSDKQPSKWD